MKTKRVLLITEAGKAWPSGWVRALIYKKLFAKYNIHADYVARQSPWICHQLGRKGVIYNHLLNAGLGLVIARLGLILTHFREYFIIRRSRNNYDAIYIQKAGSFKLVTALRRVHKGLLVFDLNDAVWLPANINYAGGKIRDILRIVDAVTCDNPYGITFARSCNQKVYLVPDPAQVELFDQHRQKKIKSNNSLIIGWIGSPGTLFNLFSIWEALEIVFSRHDEIILRIVGSGYNQQLLPRFEKVRFTCLPFYSNVEMIDELLDMDIGLFPLFDIEDSLARGILKATIYMAGETAVIASPRGHITELITDGINGMLANSMKEWVDKLEQLIIDHEFCKRIAKSGLETVRQDFSLEKSFHELMNALDIDYSDSEN